MDVLVNWIWQGSALTVVATAILRGSPRISATARYRLWWIALVLVLLLPAATALPVTVVLATLVSAGDPTVDPGAAAAMPSIGRWFVLSLTVVWALWIAVALARAAVAVATVRQMRQRARAFPAAREANLTGWNQLRRTGRAASLVVSDEVHSAAVLGFTAPVIAVAPAVLDALRDEELDPILVHEWAHVQRRDDIAQAIQVIVRAVAGLHPAVWWIDRQLHLEREAACDDWAVVVTGAPRRYAACLARLASLKVAHTDPLVVPSAMTPSDLTLRVLRLLDVRRSRSTQGTQALSMVISPVLVAMAIGIASVQLVATGLPVRDAAPRVNAQAGALAAPDFARVRPPDRSGALASEVEPSPVDVAEAQQLPATELRPKVVAGSQSPPPSAPASPDIAPGAFVPPAVIPPAVMTPAVMTPGALPLPGVRIPAPAPRVEGARSTATGVAAVEPSNAPTPWDAASSAGVGVGRASGKAAVATAGFFSKLGKAIGSSF